MADGNTSPVIASAPESGEEKKSPLFTGRTILSAAVFGILGFSVGRLIGNLGRNPFGGVGSIFFAWLGGLGGAIIAAYTSIRTQQREEREEVERAAIKRRLFRTPVTAENAPQATPPIASETAAPAARVDSVERAGTLASPTQQLSV